MLFRSPKQKTPEATCAIGRIPATGKLWVVGLGPGARDLTTPRAQDAIRNAAVVVGYKPYVDQVTDLIRPGTQVHSSGMGTEEARTALAIAKAREGRKVALVCSGDPAIYAMASPTLEQGTEGIAELARRLRHDVLPDGRLDRSHHTEFHSGVGRELSEPPPQRFDRGMLLQ